MKNISKNIKFEFGKNWIDYLNNFSKKKLLESKNDLKKNLTVSLNKRTFLDIGCGSGIHSLSANMMGAKVLSFDSDKHSVFATKLLKKKYKKNNWKILKGNVLNRKFITKLGKFDIVYSWGVLHHTGNLNVALNNITLCTKKNSILFLAIYNDQGLNSQIWKVVKKIYCLYLKSKFSKKIFFYLVLLFNISINHIFTKRNLINFGSIREFFKYVKNYEKNRGMSYLHDQLDWIGGYPFEPATADYIVNFFIKKKFKLLKLKKNSGYGNNVFIFKKK